MLRKRSLRVKLQRRREETIGVKEDNIIKKIEGLNQVIQPQTKAQTTSETKAGGGGGKVSESPVTETSGSLPPPPPTIDEQVQRIAQKQMARSPELIKPVPESPAQQIFKQNMLNDSEERKEIIRRNYIRGSREIKQKMVMLDKKYEYLQNNPISFKNAFAGAGFFRGLVGAMLNLGGGITPQGYTVDFIQKQINEELTLEKERRSEQVNILGKQENLYQSFLKILGDETSAELATENAIWTNVEKMMRLNKSMLDMGLIQEKIHKTRADALNALKDSTSLKTKAMTEYQLAEHNRKRKQDEWNRYFKEQELMKKGQLEERRMFDKKLPLRLEMGNTEFFGTNEKSVREFKQKLAPSSLFFSHLSDRISKLDKKIRSAGYKGRLVAGFAPVETEILNNYKELTFILERRMLKDRIDFTGGGNMSDMEQKILRQAFEVYRNNKGDQFWAVYKGQVARLNKDLLALDFFGTLERAKTTFDSPYGDFSKLTRGQQLLAVQKKLGVSDNQMLSVLNTSRNKSYDINQWELAKLGKSGKSGTQGSMEDFLKRQGNQK